MKRFILRIYVIGIAVVMIIALGMTFEYISFRSVIREEIRNSITLSRDNTLLQIENRLVPKRQTILNAHAFLETSPSDAEILSFLKELMNDQPNFASIYYGTADNIMLNASGWVPPEGFDLTSRPWYTAAVTQGSLIVTDAFLNVSGDHIIITIASPVYKDGALLGVIAGDITIDSILELVSSQEFKDNGYSFLVDGNGIVLAHPSYLNNKSIALMGINDLSPQLSAILEDASEYLDIIDLNETEGYFAFSEIQGTTWKIATFVPIKEYFTSERQLRLIFLITALSILLIVTALAYIQRKHLIVPMVKFNQAIQKIDLENDLSYRLDTTSSDILVEPRTSINALLERTEGLFNTLNETIEAQKRNQLLIEALSYRDQLTGLYNRRFYEEELLRLDTSRNLPFSLVLLDVNGLKLTNDAFGHQSGDELLKKVAKITFDCCRTDDIISRIGGDEFVLLLPKTSNADAEIIVDRIYKRIEHETMDAIKLSVSIGHATKTNIDQSMSDIFTLAEDNMYRKKLHESQSMRHQTIRAIIKTLNEKSEREKVHSDEVSRLSKQIGLAIGLSSEKIKELEIASLLHDIGKISIQDSILNKNGPLTESEYIEVKRHSECGYQILKSVDAYSSLSEIVLHHHERWDGMGYPYGLKGDEIPLLSRIITVADAYEAMISDRPYRRGRTHEAAIDELKACSGTQFDPLIVAAFSKL